MVDTVIVKIIVSIIIAFFMMYCYKSLLKKAADESKVLLEKGNCKYQYNVHITLESTTFIFDMYSNHEYTNIKDLFSNCKDVTVDRYSVWINGKEDAHMFQRALIHHIYFEKKGKAT